MNDKEHKLEPTHENPAEGGRFFIGKDGAKRKVEDKSATEYPNAPEPKPAAPDAAKPEGRK